VPPRLHMLSGDFMAFLSKWFALCGPISVVLATSGVSAQAANLLVTGTGEPATIATNDCVGTQCATLRGAINAAVSGDTIVFDPGALDGQTIFLTLFSNPLSPGSKAFGPSAFFVTGGKTL